MNLLYHWSSPHRTFFVCFKKGEREDDHGGGGDSCAKQYTVNRRKKLKNKEKRNLKKEKNEIGATIKVVTKVQIRGYGSRITGRNG